MRTPGDHCGTRSDDLPNEAQTFRARWTAYYKLPRGHDRAERHSLFTRNRLHFGSKIFMRWLDGFSLAQSLELPILPELVQNTIKGEACRGILDQNLPDPPNKPADRGANRRPPNLAGTACRG